MNNIDAFSSYHPLINFLYFSLVLVFGMCLMNPLCLLTACICSFLYHIKLRGKKALTFSLIYMLPLILITAIINPVFTHQGLTILMYLPNGNPITLESILYGIAAALMLSCTLTWFACYSQVMTSDKFVYLFGKIIPALSLVLSMTLRFIPKFSTQLRNVSDAQKSLGRDASSGNALRKIKNAATVLSITITWSLENAIETADSMKARGYGLAGRTAFSIYSFDDRDRSVLLWIALCGSYVIFGWISKAFYFEYYPGISFSDISAFTASFYIAYLLLCLTPLLLDRQEEMIWKKLRSEI